MAATSGELRTAAFMVFLVKEEACWPSAPFPYYLTHRSPQQDPRTPASFHITGTAPSPELPALVLWKTDSFVRREHRSFAWLQCL